MRGEAVRGSARRGGGRRGNGKAGAGEVLLCSTVEIKITNNPEELALCWVAPSRYLSTPIWRVTSLSEGG